MSDNLLTNLNPEQKEAVTFGEGPLFIIAGAGTGKTTLLTKRIVWLLQNKNVTTENILALTFTEKAAAEMKDRIDSMLDSSYHDLWVQTFHSFCEKILRNHGLEIGLNTNFEIITDTKQWILLKNHISDLPLKYYKPRANPTKFLKELLNHFSKCKDEGISHIDYIDYVEELKLDGDSLHLVPKKVKAENLTKEELKEVKASELLRLDEVAQCYSIYQKLLLENNYIDFGDLIVYTLELLKKRPHLLHAYREQFKYILVDEFQDTNNIQYKLVKLLAEPRNNILVVGDDDQSIYSFRGATIDNIMNFKDDYPNAHTVVLHMNYRSGQTILDSSYQSIQNNNPDRLEEKLGLNKKLIAGKETGSMVHHIHAHNGEHEIQLIIKKILEVKSQNPDVQWSNFAILSRAHNHTLPFIDYFEKNNIPFQFDVSQGLYTKPLVISLISYLKTLFNPYTNTAIYNVLTSALYSITYEDIGKITTFSSRKGLSFFDTIQNPELYNTLSKKSQDEVSKLLTLLQKHTQDIKQKNISEIIIDLIKETGYLSKITENDTLENYLELSYLNQFHKKIESIQINDYESSLQTVLDQLSLEIQAGDSGEIADQHIVQDSDAVHFLTIHASKGLEYPYVFIVNLVQQRFPTNNRSDILEIPEALLSEKTAKDKKVFHLQEERRLFYVAITRAQKELYLTSADYYGGVRKKKSSIFLDELGFTNTLNTEEVYEPEVHIPTTKSEKKEADKIKLAIPKKFSFTQLTEFESCPLKYKYKYLLKIKTPATPNLSFGTSIHNTLETFFKQIIINSQSNQESLFGNENDNNSENIPSLNELLNYYECSWIDDWYESKKQQEEWYNDGKSMLKDFYARFKNSSDSVFKTEQGFSLSVGTETINGRIDRIDQKDDGTLNIVDYKTGTPKEKLTKQDKRQLLLYQIATKQLFDIDVKYLTYQYLRDNSTLTFEPTEKDVKEIMLWLEKTIEDIKQSDFTAKPGLHCRFCDFKDICTFRQT